MATGKDSAEVVKFMSLFAKLKDWTDDDPASLTDLARDDEAIRKLCGDVTLAAYFLEMNERRRRELFATPVDPKFIGVWRDYEERYQSVLAGVWLSDLLPELGSIEPSNLSRADFQWESADDDAKEQAKGIESAIEFAYEATRNDDYLDEDFREGIEDAMAAWQRMKHDSGFDLRGVFRRRTLVPFVLVPRKVAAKHGSTETIGMLKNLQQAHDAFVFGATYAAIALMRSIMEAVLRDHYKAEGKDLSERIRSARGHLPLGANEAALHRLRKLANAILHLDRGKDEFRPSMDEVRLEKEIVSLLFMLRSLIEGTQ